MDNDHLISDPNRQYVAICRSSKLVEGKQVPFFYSKAFKLPLSYKEVAFALGAIDINIPLANNCGKAAWFFLNKMNLMACIEKVIPFSEYIDLSAQLSMFSKDDPNELYPHGHLDALKHKMEEVAATFTPQT